MERYFVIEVEDHSVWVYEVSRDFSSTVDYKREAESHSIVSSHGAPTPKFYGKLDALLLTADRIEKAAPITPEPCLPSASDSVSQEEKVREATGGQK